MFYLWVVTSLPYPAAAKSGKEKTSRSILEYKLFAPF